MNNKQKILIYDIETAPIIGYTWGLYEQNVISIKDDWFMLCFAYKWLGEKETHIIAQPDFRGYKAGSQDDFGVVKKLWALFDEADVILAHHGDAFDMRKSNSRFILNGLTPPSPYHTIDTKKVAKKYFKFDSNSLNNLGDYLKLGQKKQTGGFSLWLGCLAGDMKAWDKMKKYNIQDVKLLEKVYLALRPWMKGHPVINFLDEDTRVCPNCASTKVQSRGIYRTKSGIEYRRWACTACSAWSRSRSSEKNKPVLV